MMICSVLKKAPKLSLKFISWWQPSESWLTHRLWGSVSSRMLRSPREKRRKMVMVPVMTMVLLLQLNLPSFQKMTSKSINNIIKNSINIHEVQLSWKGRGCSPSRPTRPRPHPHLCCILVDNKPPNHPISNLQNPYKPIIDFILNITSHPSIAHFVDHMQNHTRFLIIGAGISGIQAALNLASISQEFILLEAQDRIGGRICTLPLGHALKQDGVHSQNWLDKLSDVAVEVGATWACEDHKQIRQLCSKYKIALDAQYYQGNHVLMLQPAKKLVMEDYSYFYKQHQETLLPLIQHMKSLAQRYEQLLTSIKQGWATKEQKDQLQEFYEKYDQMTGYEFILQGVKDPFLADLIDNEILTLQSISSKHFTALQFFTDDAGWHGIYHYLGINPDNIDGFRARTGFLSLVQAMMRDTLATLKARGMNHQEQYRFRLGHPVIEIRNEKTPVEVVCQNGEVFTCEKVITAVPSGTLGKIKFQTISEGKKIIMENQLNSQVIRMTMVFPEPFWRDLHFSGNVNFSHLFPMNEIVELTPQDRSCGILAYVFFKEGYQEWTKQILQDCEGLEGEQLKLKKYEVNKKKCLKILADLFLKGETEHPSLSKCAIFTRSLSDIPYIRDTYDSTTAPSVFRELHKKQLDHLDPYTCDEKNVIIIGSDFGQADEGSGYMEGAVSIANRKINQQALFPTTS